MPSPFPGMDRYLESSAWPDFHATFIVCLRSAIAARLPAHYLATIDERIEEHRETRIEILDRPDNAWVAVIELLSPLNKTASALQGKYQAKRGQILRQNVHLIELDLLLGGTRLPMGHPLPEGDYYALVSRADQRPRTDVYAWKLPNPLPTIPVPLMTPDPHVPVDLQAAFTTAFEMGGHATRLRYSSPPSGFIPESEREWVAQLAKSAIRG